MSSICKTIFFVFCFAVFSGLLYSEGGTDPLPKPLGILKLPNSGYPVIRKNGDSFFIESTAPSAAMNWEAGISTREGYTLPLIIESAQYGDELIYHNTRTGWLIQAKIQKIQIPGLPGKAPEDLYDLTVGFTIQKPGGSSLLVSETNPRSVKVVNRFDDRNFYFVHMSGPHLFFDGFADVNLRRLAGEINLINPSFVVITDDVSHLKQGTSKVDLILRAFDVPVFLCPGNHDFDWGTFPERWENYYWQSYHSFEYGRIHFIAFSDPAMWDAAHEAWAREDLEGHPLIVGFCSFLDNGPIYEFLRNHQPPAIAGFCGNGGNAVWGSKPRFYRTKDVRGGENKLIRPCYRLVGRSGGGIFTPVIEGYQLQWDYAQPNDGTSRANSAMIHNAIPDREFEHGRLKFVMAPGDYVVSGGDLVRSVNAGSSTVCYVHVNIGAGETFVTIVSDDAGFPLAAISTPEDGDELEDFSTGLDSLEVMGFASGLHTLEIGKGLVPGEWELIGSGSDTGLESPGLLGTWLPGGPVEAGPWTLKLTVDGVGEDRIVVNVDAPTFSNIAVDLEVAGRRISHACVPVDFNNDGWEDIFVVNFGLWIPGDANTLYRNNGDGTFTDVTASVGLGHYLWNNTAAFFDYDNDGDQDLYMMNYTFSIYNPPPDGGGFGSDAGLPDHKSDSAAAGDKGGGSTSLQAAPNRGKNIFYRNNGQAGGWTFTEISETLALDDYGFSLGGTVLDFNNDGLLDIFLVNREGPVLYKNNGAEVLFSDVTLKAGIQFPGGLHYTDAAVGDYDNDGDPDIYLTSTRKWAFPDDPPFQPAQDILFRNEGGTFVDATAQAGVGTDLFDLPWRSGGNSAYSKTAVWGDYDNDRHLDLLVTASQDRFIDDIGLSLIEGPLRNLLYHNNGDGTFSERGEEAGLTIKDQSLGAFFLDFDNDGDLDIFSSAEGTSYLFLNHGDGTFMDVTQVSGVDDWEFGQDYNVPKSCAMADFTGDMIPDIYQPRRVWYGFPGLRQNALFKNNIGIQNHWLKVETLGETSNRMGLGARIEISCGGGTQMQIREVQVGNAGSKMETAVYFGLGGFEVVDSLTITWPSGLTQTRYDVPADQVITLNESDVRRK